MYEDIEMLYTQLNWDFMFHPKQIKLSKMNKNNKLFLTSEQVKVLSEYFNNISPEDNVSLLQLINILPQFIKNDEDTLELKISKYENNFYIVAYENLTLYDNYVQFTNSELVNALFDAIIWYIHTDFYTKNKTVNK